MVKRVTGNRKTEPSAHEVARVPLIVEASMNGERPRTRFRVITAVGAANAYTLAIVRNLVRERLV